MLYDNNDNNKNKDEKLHEKNSAIFLTTSILAKENENKLYEKGW